MTPLAWFVVGYAGAILHIIAGICAWSAFMRIGAWWDRRRMDRALADALILESADYDVRA